MKASEKLYAIVKVQEGLELKAYRCTANKLTIGYGHTSNVRSGQTITLDQAIKFLHEDIASCETDINGYFKSKGITLTQGQFDACVEFCFNAGFPRFRGSTLCKLIVANPFDKGIPAQFNRWVYANGEHNGRDDDGDGITDEPGEMQKVPALVTRRAIEVKLYLS